MFVCLYVCLFVCLFVCMFVCLYVCLFVCLFFMHSVPVRARAAKLCMAHPWVQGKVKTGSTGPREGKPPQFSKNCGKFSDF
jgi:hypothetical protein